eukprot:bmy_02077T0
MSMNGELNVVFQGLTLPGEKGTTEVRRQEEWEAYLFLKHRPAKPSGVEKTSHYFTNSRTPAAITYWKVEEEPVCERRGHR